MYIKMMLRSLLRHQKRGRRLFVLMALCSAALVFLLTFRNDFSTQNRDQFIGLQMGHIQILPPGSPLLSDAFFEQTEEVPLLHLGDEMDTWIRALPQVEEGAPVISRFGMTYNLDSEQESWISLIAVPSDRMKRLLPLAAITEGTDNLAWNAGMTDVPVIHSRLQTMFGEVNPDITEFKAIELKVKDEDLPACMASISASFPKIFVSPPYDGKKDIARFLSDWKKALPNPALKEQIPSSFFDTYDWRLDDALTAMQENTNPEMVSFLNKRIFKALYPDLIVDLREPIIAGKRVTLQVSPFKTTGAMNMPIAIPVKYSGMCEIIPLYTPNSFIDLEAFREFTQVGADASTAYVIRLKNIKDTNAVKALIEAKLTEIGSDAKVADYLKFGKLYLTTGTAFSAIITILVVIFVLILLMFTVNLVLLSMIQRRKEIGTGLALGLDNMQTIIIMTGEVGVIVAVSCTAGCVIGLGAVLAGMYFGVPGMIFFAGNKLHMTVQLFPFIATYLLLIPTSLVVAFIPLLRLLKVLPVDLFREAP